MRHAKRRKLTTVDFNNALQNADVQVTASYRHILEYIYKYYKQEIWLSRRSRVVKATKFCP